MEHVYCTVLSRQRLYQAIALISSMHENIGNFLLYTLCVDDNVFELLRKMKLKGVETVRADALILPRLSEFKDKYRLNEFCWMLKPVFLDHLFTVNPALERITYIDADLFFWSDPSVIFTAQPQSPVLLSGCEVKMPFYPRSLVARLQEMMGRYNSGFISFQNAPEGRLCLNWWKDRCLESCVDKPWDGECGDQKYLDEFPALFPGVSEIATPGVNIGHWNNAHCDFYLHKRRIYIGGSRLICYHFSGFRIVDKNTIVQVYESNRTDLPFFYRIYNHMLKESIDVVTETDPGFDGFAIEDEV